MVNSIIRFTNVDFERKLCKFQCGMAHHEDYLDGRQADQRRFDRLLSKNALIGRVDHQDLLTLSGKRVLDRKK